MITSRKHSVLAKLGIVALILVTLIIFFPPFAHAWVGDDYIQFDYIKPFFARPSTAWKLFNPYELTWYYRPLQNLWLLINQLILGYNPFGYYVILLGLHAIAIALMYRVARQLKFSYLAAFACAALFALHGHWVDVVTWISSVAIVLSGIVNLLGIWVWVGYLQRPSTKKLLLTILICIIALITHEEGLLLVPFLLLVLVVERLETRAEQGRSIGRLRRRDWQPLVARLKKPTISNLTAKGRKSPISKQEFFAFAFLALVSLGYLYTQLTRENVTIDIGERTTADWLGFISIGNLYNFFQSTIFHFTIFEPILTGPDWVQTLSVVFALAILLFWVWYGTKIARWSLLWTAVHLAFIFWTLWINLPTLYAGRHIYVASIGLVIAVGATVDQITAVYPQTVKWQKRKLSVAKIGAALAVSIFIFGQIRAIINTQQRWLENAEEEIIAATQVKQLLPTINSDEHFFSVRFPIAPQFTRSVMQVWYDTPLERPGGGLPHLQAYGRANADYYVLDYDNGQVYNLMPELQEHAETIFLWAKPFTDQIVTDNTKPNPLPGNDPLKMQVVDDGTKTYLAINMTPPGAADQWLARAFTAQVPENSSLQTAVLPKPNTSYRIRITGSDGTTETVFQFDPSQETGWQETAVPLNDYWGDTVVISLEVMGDGDTAVYWANPRFVID